MDENDIREAKVLADQDIQLSKEIAKHRLDAATAKREFETFLVANLTEIHKKKSNAGIDMSVLMLRQPGFLDAGAYEVAEKAHQTWEASEALYKGKERVSDAIRGKMRLIQTMARYEGANT